MRITTFLRKTFKLAAILAVAGGCAERPPLSPTETVARADEIPAALLGGLDPVLNPVYGLLTPAKAVNWLAELPSDVRVTKTIGRNGGTLEIPSLGFRLEVPKGAVDGNTTFSVTAVAGSVVAYDFAPEGATFNKALTITQSLSNTNWFLKGYVNARAGYYKDRSLIDQVLDIVWTSELLSASVTSGTVRFQVKHFSGYMVAGC